MPGPLQLTSIHTNLIVDRVPQSLCGQVVEIEVGEGGSRPVLRTRGQNCAAKASEVVNQETNRR